MPGVTTLTIAVHLHVQVIVSEIDYTCTYIVVHGKWPTAVASPRGLTLCTLDTASMYGLGTGIGGRHYSRVNLDDLQVCMSAGLK